MSRLECRITNLLKVAVIPVVVWADLVERWRFAIPAYLAREPPPPKGAVVDSYRGGNAEA